jgi:hypothetical protein
VFHCLPECLNYRVLCHDRPILPILRAAFGEAVRWAS